MNGQDVTPDQTLSFLVANIEPGTRIPVELIRDGARRRLTVTVGKRPTEEELAQSQMFDPEAEETEDQQPQQGSEVVAERLGLQVLALTPADRSPAWCFGRYPRGRCRRGEPKFRRGAQGAASRRSYPQRELSAGHRNRRSGTRYCRGTTGKPQRRTAAGATSRRSGAVCRGALKLKRVIKAKTDPPGCNRPGGFFFV